MDFVKILKLSLLLYCLLFIINVNSWKKCSETFCKRVRNSPANYPRYYLDLDTVVVSSKGVDGYLLSDSQNLHLRLSMYSQTIVNLFVYNRPNMRRHTSEEVLLNSTNVSESWKILKVTSSSITVENGNISAVLFGKPFKIELSINGKLTSIINPQDRLVVETGSQGRAVAIDVSFPGAQRAFGIPQHAENLALRTTTIDNRDPYRLYNVDNGRYNLGSTEALYGSVPVLYAHGIKHSTGVFWSNTAQTWVDITIFPNQVSAFFMSESGFFDLFVYTGPTLAQVVQQYASSTGTAPLPQYFALGYHQSRNSYMTQPEVVEVVEQFDKNELSLDSVWLGINYTDNKKYFTWDPIRFPDPIGLQRQLNYTNRKLIAIIDPHFKRETGYFVHDNATRNKYYIKDYYGSNDYVGKGWPGDSSWIDFKNDNARNYYKSLFSIYYFRAKNVHIWNEMNEPTVFNNPNYENTFNGDLRHVAGIIHRDVHNAYGYEQSMSTFQGLIDRYGSEEDAVRPFVLSRSHYAGSQRFAAIWTGDNYASWDYLEFSIPMCLTSALAGISFCGADVGGFAGIPDDELYQRWYQAGAWLPFFRGNSAADAPRREPYLYSEGVKSRVRAALNERYAHLPYWYTLFWEHTRNGDPVIRPITYQYPDEEDALDVDNQILVGNSILVIPVTQKRTSIVSAYLPGSESEIWYDVNRHIIYHGLGLTPIYVNLDLIPVLYRGGSIIPRKDKPRPSTAATKYDNYTLYVCLDINDEAAGSLYVDDYETYRYKLRKEYLYLGFQYKNNTLTSYKIDEDANYNDAAQIEKIIVLNPSAPAISIRLNGADQKKDETKVTYGEDGTLSVSNLLLNLQKPFTIEFL
ncbi:hypothetical protein ILUMI_21708 [Ignelater luminosus]|uniref:Glucosidase II subunit alpha n=1 Tax=Ignelater luminosus TaxID=2038154 RepID=A0A8K0FXR9_IGNLU|nr:hypothetical protein ILUMI_21708 [Ignelater luminosus]